MKNLVKILGIGALAIVTLSFSACTFRQESSSQPVVEIVERSDLLNIIDTGYIITGDMEQRLSQLGLTAGLKNLQLTSDYSAVFDLELTNSAGQTFVLSMPAFLSYDRQTVSGRDSFENVQLYWGDIKKNGEDILITGIDSVTQLTADFDAGKVDLSGFLGENGYILTADAHAQYGYAVTYRTGSGDGLAVFDIDGNITDNALLPESSLVQPAENGYLPFDIQSKPVVSFREGGDLLLTGGGAAFFYNTGEDVLLCGGSPLSEAEKEGTKVYLYVLTPDESSKGKVHNTLFMAVKAENNSSDCIIFDGDLLGGSLHTKEMVISHNTPTLKCSPVGIEMDFDFSADKISRIRYRLPREALGERLYVSQNRQYQLYSFSPEMHNGIETYNFALKEVSTGKIGYLGCGGLINGSYPGETGFLSAGEIYVLGDNDFRIYTTDVENTTPIFSLSDYIPLGEDINEKLEDRILVAAVREGDNIIAVYYDTSYESGDEIYLDETKTRLKATYQVAVFAAGGSVQNSFDTGVSALAGYCPVTVYQKSDSILLYATYKDTDTVLVRGSLDITSGEFAVTQEYTPYTE